MQMAITLYRDMQPMMFPSSIVGSRNFETSHDDLEDLNYLISISKMSKAGFTDNPPRYVTSLGGCDNSRMAT